MPHIGAYSNKIPSEPERITPIKNLFNIWSQGKNYWNKKGSAIKELIEAVTHTPDNSQENNFYEIA